MEEKKKVSLVYERQEIFAHLILTKEQYDLLTYLDDKEWLREDISYVIEDEGIKWEEIC